MEIKIDKNIMKQVAHCSPDGQLHMDSDLFDMATFETLSAIKSMPDSPAKLKKYIDFADFCKRCSMDSQASTYYSIVLERTIPEGTPIPELWGLAQRAYNSLASLSWCDDEFAWERSSSILDKYQELFEKKP